MSELWPYRLTRELDELRAKDRYRSLKTYSGIDFGSNDYLGFAIDGELKEAALRNFKQIHLSASASASRLLPGHHTEHLEAEKVFARFVGTESALLFNSGFDANTALLTTLPTRHDLILYDERSHASIYDGVRSSLAKSKRFQHNSAEDLARLLAAKDDSEQIFVVLESLYSMDGDVAALKEIGNVAEKANAVLMVDEAHGTGVLGTKGEGLVKNAMERNERIISVHTCGKALGAAGAFVCGTKTVIDYLVNKARPFIFTTALPPIVPLQIIAAIEKLERNGAQLVTQLRERSSKVRHELHRSLCTWNILEGETPIVSIIIGSDANALTVSQQLREIGFEIPAIRPPSVPEGSSRLRMNISLRHSEEQLRTVVAAIVQAEREAT